MAKNKAQPATSVQRYEFSRLSQRFIAKTIRFHYKTLFVRSNFAPNENMFVLIQSNEIRGPKLIEFAYLNLSETIIFSPIEVLLHFNFFQFSAN